MIESGWIFPDGQEISCGDETWLMHDVVVRNFIRGLKNQNPKAFKIIQKEIDALWEKQGSRALTNYAISRLGWIKVGTSIWQNIIYAGYDWQSDLIRPYEDKGYRPKRLCCSSTYYMPLNCDYLRTIRGGR